MSPGYTHHDVVSRLASEPKHEARATHQDLVRVAVRCLDCRHGVGGGGSWEKGVASGTVTHTMEGGICTTNLRGRALYHFQIRSPSLNLTAATRPVDGRRVSNHREVRASRLSGPAGSKFHGSAVLVLFLFLLLEVRRAFEVWNGSTSLRWPSSLGTRK